MGVAFDTLKFVEKLEGGGFSHAQAKAAAEAFADATGEQLATRADLTSLSADFATLAAATKADIANLAAATKADIANLAATTKADIANLAATTKAEMRELRAEMKGDLAENKSEILKWMFGQTLLLIGVMMALLRFGH